MRETVVQVENLGKKYSLGNRKNGDLRQTFRESLRSFWGKDNLPQEEFWALKDLTFEIKRGEVVGIIGRNGAGKSTLLKILSRITTPTTGRFEIDGRVSSLLEVGTGFHFELTGRENIFLNGTILGMRRSEIKAKFDEIVAFSGVEDFLDTPVKHYSSGMRVRLAFSIGAHLEPEILIVDEVLAVGDAEFQQKCLGKMDEVSKAHGRTILFVSHNLSAVEHLCSTGILLDKGHVVAQGDISYLVSKYLHSGAEHDLQNMGPSPLSNGVQVTSFQFLHQRVSPFQDLEYEFTIDSAQVNRFTDLAILIYNHLNERVGIVDLRHRDLIDKSSRSHVLTTRGKIKALPLIAGSYHCGLFVSSSLCHGDFLNIAKFEINRPDSGFVPYASKYCGYVEFDHCFSIQ